MSDHRTNEKESAISGSTHNWERGYTGPSRTTPYRCRQCGDGFNHHYPSTPNIYEAMRKAGVPDVCPAAQAALKERS